MCGITRGRVPQKDHIFSVYLDIPCLRLLIATIAFTSTYVRTFLHMSNQLLRASGIVLVEGKCIYVLDLWSSCTLTHILNTILDLLGKFVWALFSSMCEPSSFLNFVIWSALINYSLVLRYQSNLIRLRAWC